MDGDAAIDVLKNSTGKQIAVIFTLVGFILGGVYFIENRYAKIQETKTDIESTRVEIKKINEDFRTQIITLSVLTGQMSALLNSGSGRVVVPMKIPDIAPQLTPEILAEIEASRAKVSGNEAAIKMHNELLKQQSAITEQLRRLPQ